MIPQIIHLFHDGPKDLPMYAADTVAWANNHNYEVKIWKAEDLPDFHQKQWLIDNQQWSCLSDVARQLAIYTHGGFYLDTDCEIVGDLEQLRKYDWFATFEPPRFVNCAFSGGVAVNRISKAMFDRVMNFDFAGYKGKITLPAYVGPWMQTEAWKAFGSFPPSYMAKLHGGKASYTILPTSIGFGLTYQEYHRGNRNWPANGIVRHHWAKSW